jgi:Tol biopolymer transport system component
VEGWSADGSTLVFYNQRGKLVDIFSVAADGGGLRRIGRVPATDFAGLSPDRRRVAFAESDCSKERSLTIRIRTIRNQALRTFNTPARGGSIDVYWSPGGDEIAYVHTWLENEPCRGLYPSSETYRASLDGHRRILRVKQGWTTVLAYAHHGRQLAATGDCAGDASSCHELFVAEDDETHSLRPGKVEFVSNPIWSRDAEEVFVAVSDALGPPDYLPEHPRLVAINVATKRTRLITPLPDSFASLESISPDGALIAVSRGAPAAMWTVPTAGGPLRRLPWPPKPGYVESSEAVFISTQP